ncbi:MAG: ABC transporter permease [Calditrichaceae bacterium]|nr:ABC transporter permease [Calditrichaceae bacterium]MBN2708553.1 ABC transporter permease [Calditrichaceae bacterium]RQV96864.1 MAG: ABC transporter permease [Calditrichota bacterium]
MNSIIKPRQLGLLISAHAKELMREPGVLFWGIIFPILMALGLGIAFTKKADMTVNIAVIEPRLSENSNTTLIGSFLTVNGEKIISPKDSAVSFRIVTENEKLGNTIYSFHKMDWEQGMIDLKRGKISILVDEKNGQIYYHFDPRNPDAQLTYLKLSGILKEGVIIGTESRENIEPLTVTGSRYIDFFIPGMIAMGIMMSTMWGISYRLIEMRSQKLLRRMVATPMKKSHFLIALISVRTMMNFIESFLLFLFAYLVFDIRIQGDVSALILIFIAGNFAFAGISVFVSCHTAKTEIGNGLINIIVMPMMVLSGIFFSYHNFPEWVIPVIQKLPLTMLADGIRSIFIEGAGYHEVAIPFMVLMLIGLVFFSVGLKIFKWH